MPPTDRERNEDDKIASILFFIAVGLALGYIIAGGFFGGR